MKTVFALLAATTALGALAALPVTASVCRLVDEEASCAASAQVALPAAETIWLASSDDDDDDHDDDDDEDCDDDEDEGDCAPGKAPAPAGTVAPPANGLFGTGKPPVVQMN